MRFANLIGLASLAILGTAHADALKPGPGFDRVGVAAFPTQHTADTGTAPPIRLSGAPGESTDASVASYPARKREMARRLMWLMLSAR